ncbi:glycosyltransferase family 4 protein [Gryllotalpicola daejeonensis]
MGTDAFTEVVLTPWGVGGGYSGPVTFLGRLFSAVCAEEPDARIDVLYRDRGGEEVPAWATDATALSRRAHFGLREQLAWGVRAARAVRQRAGSEVLVHLQGLYLANLVAAYAVPPGRAVLLPVLERGDLVPAGAKPLAALKSRLLRRVVRRARVGFAITCGIERELRALGMPEDRIVPLGNAVDESVFTSEGRAVPGADAVRIGFVGKLGPIKRPQLLLDAVAMLRERGVDASAVFVGPFASAEFEGGFRKRVAELGLDEHVVIAGMRSDVASVLRAEIDVFVLPSSSEGMPGALAEAMMTGLPAVVTDVGAMGDTVIASGGGLVVTPDGERIAEAVERILDDGAWAEYSRRAADFAHAHFGSRAVAAAYLEGIGRRPRGAAHVAVADPATSARLVTSAAPVTAATRRAEEPAA